jgi:ankyrin repeat protein
MTDTCNFQDFEQATQSDENLKYRQLIDFYRAVCRHDIVTVQNFLDHHINPDRLLLNKDFATLKTEYKSIFDSEEQTTPLIAAVLCNDTAIAKLLITNCANVNLHVDFKYYAALLCACDTEGRGYDGVEMAGLLLDAGADIHDYTEDGKSVLLLAEKNNSPDVSSFLKRL